MRVWTIKSFRLENILYYSNKFNTVQYCKLSNFKKDKAGCLARDTKSQEKLLTAY